MRTKKNGLWALFLLPGVFSVYAHDDVSVFHAFRLELDAGESRESGSIRNWSFDGWLGGDTHKLRIKSEGEVVGGDVEHNENWLLYSYNMDTFWDVQTGIRYDSDPASTAYFVLGVSGLAPYFIETELHGFVGEDGNLRLRFHAEKDFLLTRQWVLQPAFELNASAHKENALHLGSGWTDAALSVQLRYEITRRIAPYIEVKSSHLLGSTKNMAEVRGDDRSDNTVTVGVRLLF